MTQSCACLEVTELPHSEALQTLRDTESVRKLAATLIQILLSPFPSVLACLVLLGQLMK